MDPVWQTRSCLCGDDPMLVSRNAYDEKLGNTGDKVYRDDRPVRPIDGDKIKVRAHTKKAEEAT